MNLRSDIRAARTTLPTFLLMGVLWCGFHSYAPQIKTDAGVSDWQFGIALFVAALGSLAAMACAPWFERLAGARSMILAGVLMILSFQVVPLIGSYRDLLAVMLLVGAALGLMDVIMNAQVARDEFRSGRSLMALNHGVYSLSYGIAAFGAAALRGAGQGPVVYYMLTLLAGGLVLWGVRSVPQSEDDNDTAEGKSAGLPSVVFWAGGVVLLGFACENAVESWSALHVERTLGGSAAQGPIGPASLGLTMAVGRFSGHVLSARYSEMALLRIGAVLAAAGALVAATAVAPWMAYLGFGAAGLGISVQAPLALALIGRAVPAAMRTRAIARGAVIGYVGFFIGPPVVGAVAEGFGLRAAFLVVAVALTCVPILLAGVSRRVGDVVDQV